MFAGTRTISKIILVTVCDVLLFSPSLCIFFFALVFYFVLSSGFWVDFSGLLGAFRSFFFRSWLSFFLCFAGFLPSVLPWSLLSRGRLCSAFIEPAAASVVTAAPLLNDP